MAPICGFVVFPLRGGRKVVVTFFFPWITVSVRRRLLFSIRLLFLLSSGVFSGVFDCFLPLCGSTWGDRPLAVFCWQLWWFFLCILWGWPVCSEPLSRTAGSRVVREGPWSCPASPPLCLLARDLTGQETTQQTCVCPCKLLTKKFSPGLVSCDLAVEQIQNS